MPRSKSVNYDLLLQALMESKQNNIPGGAGHLGRPESALAMNAYLGDMPLSDEQQREQGVMDVMTSRVNAKEMEEANFQLKDKNRRFAQRTGVNEIGGSPMTAEGMGFTPDSMASHKPTGAIRTIKRAPMPTELRQDVTSQFGQSPETRTIRRFSSNTTPTDPDAAMGDEARARIHPSVLAAGIDADSAQYVADSKAKADAPAGPSAYSTERATRNLQSVDELMGKVNRWTTGAGSYLSALPETDALNFKSELDTLLANIGFGELTEMREASKTGGALGQIAVRELDLLQATLGSLNRAQRPEEVKEQLQKVKSNIERWQAVKSGQTARNGAGGGVKIRSITPIP